MKNRLTQQEQTAGYGRMKNIFAILLCAMVILPVIQLAGPNRGYTYVQAKEQGSGNANTEEGTEPTKTEREEASRNSTQDKGTNSTKKDTTQTENKLVETSVAESGVLSSKTVDVETADTATTSGTETGGTLNVKITLTTDQEWVHTSADVKVKIKNLDKKKNLKIKSVQAKIGQNGSWRDITDVMQLTISENCTVYVLVTDEDGNTCEKNRYIECFDKDAPVLNAAVNDGLLSVQCKDTQSGVKAAYVNGYEFTKLTDGTLNIRLQKFDAGYQYFTIQAMDKAGNMSEVYKIPNPYYTDPETEGKAAGVTDPKEQLPTNAKATEPTQAKAEVTEHTKTDSAGNVLQTQNGTGTIQKGADAGSGSESKNSTASGNKTDTRGGTNSGTTNSGTTNSGATDSGTKADAKGGTNSGTRTPSEAGTDSGTGASSDKGKEFYTIQTDNEKVFYLIIERSGEEEKVHFLTDVSENDLLNVTQQKNETLPQNSAALESAIPTEAARPEEKSDNILTDGLDGISDQIFGTETEAAEMTDTEEKKDGTVLFYVILCVFGAAAIGAGYYFKVVKKRKELYLDEDEDDPYYEDYGEDEEDWRNEENKNDRGNEENKRDRGNEEYKEVEIDKKGKKHEEVKGGNDGKTDSDSIRMTDREKTLYEGNRGERKAPLSDYGQ